MGFDHPLSGVVEPFGFSAENPRYSYQSPVPASIEACGLTLLGEGANGVGAAGYSVPKRR